MGLLISFFFGEIMFNEFSNINFLKTLIALFLCLTNLFDDGSVDSSHLISENYQLTTERNSTHTFYFSFPQRAFKSA